MNPTPRFIRLILVVACLSVLSPARLATGQVSTQLRTPIAIPHEEIEGASYSAQGETLVDWEARKISIRLSIMPDGDGSHTMAIELPLDGRGRLADFFVLAQIDIFPGGPGSGPGGLFARSAEG